MCPSRLAQLTQLPHNRLMDTCCREETHTAILSKEPYLPSHLSMECKDFLRQVCPPCDGELEVLACHAECTAGSRTAA